MKIAIIGDVHGRDFWKKVEAKDYDKIVFLGDYVDPYALEFPDLSYKELSKKTIDNFMEIIKFKQENTDKVILLFGNHDCSYLVSPEICNCRLDRDNYYIIQNIFKQYIDLFQPCYLHDKYFFTHAGITDFYVSCYDQKCKTVEELNNQLMQDYKDRNFKGMRLDMIGFRRGGYDTSGSFVWSDIYEEKSVDFGFQIYGHTALSKPCLLDNELCADCKEVIVLEDDNFYLNEEKLVVYGK